MTRLLGSAECLSLIDLVISEAEADTGTWCLATYVKIRNVIPHFPRCDLALFVKRVVDLTLEPSTKCTTRYKLAQILSAVHGLALPEFENAIHACLQPIEDSCDEIARSGDLGKATVKLLKSLAVERAPKVVGAFDLHSRRVSATPVHSPIDVAVGHSPRTCRSPDPGISPSASSLI
jgi:hypothetical protein